MDDVAVEVVRRRVVEVECGRSVPKVVRDLENNIS